MSILTRIGTTNNVNHVSRIISNRSNNTLLSNLFNHCNNCNQLRHVSSRFTITSRKPALLHCQSLQQQYAVARGYAALPQLLILEDEKKNTKKKKVKKKPNDSKTKEEYLGGQAEDISSTVIESSDGSKRKSEKSKKKKRSKKNSEGKQDTNIDVSIFTNDRFEAWDMGSTAIIESSDSGKRKSEKSKKKNRSKKHSEVKQDTSGGASHSIYTNNRFEAEDMGSTAFIESSDSGKRKSEKSKKKKRSKKHSEEKQDTSGDASHSIYTNNRFEAEDMGSTAFYESSDSGKRNSDKSKKKNRSKENNEEKQDTSGDASHSIYTNNRFEAKDIFSAAFIESGDSGNRKSDKEELRKNEEQRKTYGILQWYENYLNLNAQKLSHGDARTQLMTHAHSAAEVVEHPTSKPVDLGKQKRSKTNMFKDESSMMVSFIDANLSLGKVNECYTTLERFFIKWHTESNLFHKNEAIRQCFTLLLKHMADDESLNGQTNLEQARRFVEILKQFNIRPRYDFCAALLLTFAKRPGSSDADIQAVIEFMNEKHVSLEKLRLDKNIQFKMKTEDLDLIEETVTRVKPDVTLHKNRTLDLDFPFVYENHLLWKLNMRRDPTNVVEMNPLHGSVSLEDVLQGFDEQLVNEEAGIVAVERITANLKTNQERMLHRQRTKKVKEVEEDFRTQLMQNLQKIMLDQKSRQATSETGMSLYPFLVLFPLEDYVNILLKACESIAIAASDKSVHSMVIHDVANQVEQHWIIQHNAREKEKLKDKMKKYAKDFTSEDSLPNSRLCFETLLIEELDTRYPSWKRLLKQKLGQLLVDTLFDLKARVPLHAKDPSKTKSIPVFHIVTKRIGAKPQNCIQTLPAIQHLYSKAKETLHFSTEHFPMLSPPVPWVDVRRGVSALSTSIQFARAPNAKESLLYYLDHAPKEELIPVLDSLNVLGSCPWRVNTQVLDVIIEVFRNKGNEKLDIPVDISSLQPLPKLRLDDFPNFEDYSASVEKRSLELKKRSEMYSLWCTMLYRLSLANKVRDKVFWNPQNLDFRGRAYTIAPHLTHLGEDSVRSMFKFAKGKPLGETGLDWLMIHLTNLTGARKRCSNEERLEYAKEMLNEIFDSADKPLKGNRWWQTSEEPWQTLAACMEITSAMRSPSPQNFISNLPVHQDGSCNGLQHYAALGRDVIGAKSVNLKPSQLPSDVYNDVLNMVAQLCAKDAEEGDELAKAIHPCLERKIVKQTVMTSVYGVTAYGARAQIRGKLEDIDEFPQDLKYKASAYIAHKVFESLHGMFSSAKEIQDWFIQITDHICKAHKTSVQWKTPLGLPVEQPYYKYVKYQYKDEKVSLKVPDVVKQKNAFPPNFIHSLDSTHMMLTALHCYHAGLTFASVHDSYWTHACDIDTMNKICREQFVALHNEPILYNLADYIKDAVQTKHARVLYKGSAKKAAQKQQFLEEILDDKPKLGGFNLREVLDSTYFFS